jgi:hypothetical protein
VVVRQRANFLRFSCRFADFDAEMEYGTSRIFDKRLISLEVISFTTLGRDTLLWLIRPIFGTATKRSIR